MSEKKMAAWLECRRSAMRDLYVFLGGNVDTASNAYEAVAELVRAHIAMLEHRAEQHGRKAGKAEEMERMQAMIGVMVDEMRRDAEEQRLPFDGDEGMYRNEVDALRALEKRMHGKEGGSDV
jgi:hypothetical protein